MTLIEVLVALTIATALTALAVPSIGRTVERIRVNGTTRELVVALKTARQIARTSGADAQLELDVVRRVYRTDNGEYRPLVAPSDATFKLLTAESERLNESAGAIRFFPDGSSTGGTVTLTQGGRTHRVEIDWLTGYVHAVTAEAP